MSNTPAPKITYGLKNIHYAILTRSDDRISYDTPKKFPGAVNLTLTAANEAVEFYADDILYYNTNDNSGYAGEFETALVPDDFRKNIFGDEIIDGLQYENAGPDPKHIALMAEFATDAVAKRICLFDVLCGRPDVSSKTREKKRTPQTQKMSLTVNPIEINGKIIVKCTTCADTAPEKFSAFFDAVPMPTDTVQTAQNAGASSAVTTNG